MVSELVSSHWPLHAKEFAYLHTHRHRLPNNAVIIELKMSKPVGLTHILTELSSLDDLGVLLKRSARLKYTCISASKKYLALGSNTGGVYIFSRDTLKYQQVVFADSNSTPVTGIRLSPTSQHIAIAVSSGHVSVFELNIECRAKPERIRNTFDHAGHAVMAMTWDTSGQKLFIGDDGGKLTIIYVPNKKSKTLFALPSEVISFLNVSIFQMDWWVNKLLVSTLTHCFLFDTNRDGEFGACIFLEPASLYPVIYCARPGSRIWEVDFEGKVLNTHQFKQLLSVPPVPVLNIMSDGYSPSETEIQGGQSISFNKMIPLGSLILTWSSKGLYLFDPINVKVIVWTDSFQGNAGIRDVALYGNDAYLFLEDSSVRRLTLLSIYPLFQLLASRARWSLMSCLLLSSDQINMHVSIVKRVRKDLFEALVNGLRESGNMEMVERLYGMMDDVSESSVHSVSLGDDFMGVMTNDEVSVMGHTTLPSGMVVVSEGFSVDLAMKAGGSRDYDGVMDDIENGFGGEMVGKEGDSVVGDGEMDVDDDGGDEIKGCMGSGPDIGRRGVGNGYVMWNGEKKDIGNDELAQRNGSVGDDGRSSSDQELICDENGQSVLTACGKDDGDSGERTFDNEVMRNCVSDNGGISSVTDVVAGDSVDDGKDSLRDMGDEFVENVAEDSVERSVGNKDEEIVGEKERTENSLQSISNEFESGLEENITMHIGNNDEKVEEEGPSVVDDCVQDMGNSNVVDILSDGIQQDRKLMTSSSSGSISLYNNNKGETGKSVISDNDHEQNYPSVSISKARIGDDRVRNNKNSHEPGVATSLSVDNSVRDKQSRGVSSSQESAATTGVQSVEAVKDDASQKEPSTTHSKTAGLQRRFSNVHIKKEDSDVIAKAVRRPKKKKKKSHTMDQSIKNMPDSLQDNNILRSASCGDLVHSPLYQHTKEKDTEDTLSISTISSIGEDDALEGLDERATFTLSSSSFGGVGEDGSPEVMTKGVRKQSYDTLSLTDDPAMDHLRRESLYSPTHQEEKSLPSRTQVIPPLIDRLAAAKGGDRRPAALRNHNGTTGTVPANRDAVTLNVSSLTDSGEFSVRMSQLPSSLSAMKDGLSLKLKTQTRHFIKSFKEKNPLTVKSPTSPLLLLSQNTKRTVKDSNSAALNQPEDPTRQNNCATATGESRKLSAADIERMSLEQAAALVVKDELESLYKKAVHIQSAVKTSNLVMQPVVFKSILNTWCRDLNSTMYKFLKELQRRKEKENEKEKSEETEFDETEEDVDEKQGCDEMKKDDVESKKVTDIIIDDKTNIDSIQNDSQYVDSLEGNDSSCAQSSTVSPDRVSESLTRNLDCPEDSNTNISSSASNLNQNQYSSSNYSSQYNHHHNHPAIEQDSSVLFLTEILNVNDPFHLSTNQHQAFHDLCTLCYLCGATGDILSSFQLSEGPCYIGMIQSLLPKRLYSPFYTAENSDNTSDFLSLAVQKGLAKELLDNDSTYTCPCQYISRHEIILKENVKEKPTFSNGNCPFEFMKKCEDSSDDNKGCDVNKTSQNALGDSSNKMVIGEQKEHSERVKQFDKSLTSSQVEDLKLAVFLRVFFFILDYPLVKQQMNAGQCSRPLAWVSLITCCHEKGKTDIVSSLLSDRQTNAAIDYLRSGILMHPSALIGHLHRLFQYTPAKTAEFCSEVQTSITALEVVAMCVLSDKPPAEPLLRFARKYIIDLPFFHRSAEFGKLCDISVIRLLLLRSLVSSSGSDEKKDNTRKEAQSAASNLISLLPSDWLEQILSRVTSVEEQNLILHLCLTLKQWRPAIRLMSRRQDKRPLMDLLVAVGDIDLVSENGYIPQTTEEWRMLLSCFLHTEGVRHVPTPGADDEDSKRHSEKTSTDVCDSTIITDKNYSSQNKNQDKKFQDDNNDEEEEGDNHNNDNDENLSPYTKNDPDSTSENIQPQPRIKDQGEASTVDPPISSVQNENEYSSTSASSSTTNKTVECESPFPSPASPMTWDSLAKLLVINLGGAAAVEMMCEHLCGVAGRTESSSDRQIPLTPSLLQACLSDFSIEANQNQVCHEMLERLSVHMWAKKPGFLPPSVGHVIRMETKGKDGGSKDLEEDLACHRQINLVQSTTGKVLMSENFGVHWGQDIDMNQTCQTCQMSLRLIVSHDLPGVVLFPCGDAFHKKCCPGSSCPILH